jgi:hypothetical protein
MAAHDKGVLREGTRLDIHPAVLDAENQACG